MGTITKISTQRKLSQRVNVYIDENFAFSVFESSLLDNNLYKGRQLTDKEIKTIKNQDDNEKCLESAYRFLSYRPSSEKEINDKLLKKYAPETVTGVIKTLKLKKYIDDRQFIKFWLENRIASRGPLLLRNELQKKGVKNEMIEKELTAFDDEEVFERAKNLILSKPKYKNLETKEIYKKIVPYLARRGYPYEIIKRVIKEIIKKTSAE
jgi:regulatory protein